MDFFFTIIKHSLSYLLIRSNRLSYKSEHIDNIKYFYLSINVYNQNKEYEHF